MSALIRILCLICVLSGFAPKHSLAVPNSHEARTLLVDTAGEWYPGDRIRVVSPEPYSLRTTGWFSSLQGDSAIQVRMSRGEPPVTVGLYQIGALEEKVGTKRHVVTGMVVGLVIGTLVGFAVAPDEDPVVAIPFSNDYAVNVRMNGMRQTYIVMGAVSGMLLGGTIGYFATTDRFGLVATFD